MQNTVNSTLAFFRNEADAENAIRDLKQAGFRPDQIGTSLEDYDIDNVQQHGRRGFWEKVSDFFSGDPGYERRDTSSVRGYREESPSIGPTLGIPDRYRDRIDAGGVFVMVYGDNAAQAEPILIRNNGELESDLSSFQSTGSDFAEVERTNLAGQGHRIQLLSEVLRIRKDRVQRGEVRLRKEVVTEQQNIQVPVEREELVIERMPGQGREATREIGTEGEIRVPLTEERASVKKVPVVREEVRVDKRAVEDASNISDETRREELRVEKEGDVRELDKADISQRKPKKAA
jgi:uncharacterized protein (TIGR02271 family)